MQISIIAHGAKEAVARLGQLPRALREALRTKTNKMALLLETRIRSKLSGPVLKVRSGQLRESIGHRVIVTNDAVVATVYSEGVKYAGIQEYGGRTPAHIILPNKAKMLSFM